MPSRLTRWRLSKVHLAALPAAFLAAAELLPPPLLAAQPAQTSSRVPDVAVTPAAVETAPRVDAPIAEVTVYSDRARVRRRGKVSVKPGTSVVRLPDLPSSVLVDTVRLGATGARLLRVETATIEGEWFAVERAKTLLDELDALDDRMAELDDRVQLEEWRASVVTGLRPAGPVPEDKREGRKALVVDVPSWWQGLDFLRARATEARTEVAVLANERRALDERRNKVRADLAGLQGGDRLPRAVQVSAVLEATAGGNAELELAYFVPGARWRPIYDLGYAPARAQARLDTTALVEQTTGEDWTDAALAFSTAVPGRGVEMPELLTWTLGERSDFVPRMVAKPRAPGPGLSTATPASSASSASELTRGLDEALVRERIARTLADDVTDGPRLAKGSDRPMPYEPMKAMKAMEPAPSAARAMAMPATPPSRVSSPIASAPAISRRRGDEEELSLSYGAAAGTPSSAASANVLPLALSDTPEKPSFPALINPEPWMPAVSAGGLDFVYPATGRVTVPSNNQQIRVPLGTQTFRAAAFYEATPGLATTAFLRARVRNDGKRPLLRGPATIFSDGELVGVGDIETTGPGGEIELPLGADQDIRLVRQIVPSTRTTGLIMKSEETTYEVRLQVGNYKKQAAVVELLEQVPKSRQDKVQVKLLGAEPALQGPPDADGVVKWRLEVGAGATRTATLRYVIVRPKGWVLGQ